VRAELENMIWTLSPFQPEPLPPLLWVSSTTLMPMYRKPGVQAMATAMEWSMMPSQMPPRVSNSTKSMAQGAPPTLSHGRKGVCALYGMSPQSERSASRVIDMTGGISNICPGQKPPF
jgi:hypothetical protein